VGTLPARIDAGLVALTAAAMAFAAVLFLPQVLGDGDIYWHIAAGRWMLDNTAVLRIDPFSLTKIGHPWQTLGWLGDIATALAYVGFGWNGVLLLFAAVAALAAGVLARALSRRFDAPALLAILALVFAAATPALLARPYLLALPLLVIWLAGLAGPRDGPPSLKLIVVMILWANLHASFLIGLMLAALFGLEAVLRDRRAWRGWSLFVGAALIASFVTPYGMDTFVEAARLLGPAGLALLAGLSGVAAAVSVTVRATAVARPLRIAALIWLGFLAWQNGSDRILFAVAAPMLVAEPLARLLSQHGLAQRLRWRDAVVFGVILAAAAGLRLAMPAERGDDAFTPTSALAQVPAAVLHAPVLNEAAFGGYLIFNDIRPFIDSRSAFYGPAFLKRYQRMIRPDQDFLAASLMRYRIRWTIFAPGNPVVHAMDGMKGWHRLYGDTFAVVHVRDDD